jgi:hypothetical protein
LDRDEVDSKDLLSSTDDEEFEREVEGDCMSMEEDCWFEDWVQETARELQVLN